MVENHKSSTTIDEDKEPGEDLIPNGQDQVTFESEEVSKLLYNVSDRVPVHIAIFSALQHTLSALSAQLAVSSFVVDVVCASDFPDIRRDLLSSTLLMNGVTTLLMVIVGIRLPLFQGAASEYIVPLLAMKMVETEFCTLPTESGSDKFLNVTMEMGDIGSTVPTTDLDVMEEKRALVLSKLCELQGCLILVGIIHSLVGLTGIGGLLLKCIGPITIVPAMILMGTYLARATSKFARVHWGLSILTTVTAIVMSLYLSKRKMPCPAWSREKGFHIFWYPFHQIFSILIGILVGWGVAAVMTYAGALTDDSSKTEYMARTDARADIIWNANWFKVPYPNQFGTPTFNTGVFIAFFIGTLNSILDSIGDYYACARTCNVPPPPRYAVNRAIIVEGFGTTLSGVLGCGHATTTYGGNIGILGVTKVASRDVMLWTSVLYIVFGLVGKVSAVFITIPLPVLGGAMIVMFGMFNGIVISNLQVVSLSSTRNLAIIGTSLLIGLMVPYWLEVYPDDLKTGNAYNDNLFKTLLSNPILCGGLTACFLDNSVPGTARERGITAWQEPEKFGKTLKYSEGLGIYTPLLPSRWLSWRVMKYLPFCQYKPAKDNECDHNEQTV